MRRLTLVYPESQAAVDGIRDHGRHLARALESSGAVRTMTAPAPLDHCGNPHAPLPDALLIQYQPFAWGRYGFAPGLMADLWRVRRATPRPQIMLMVHETFMPLANWQWIAMGLWQRLQLECLRLASDRVFASTESWTDMLAGRYPCRRTTTLPVGSNLPDMSGERSVSRRSLDLSEEAVAIVSFGTPHPHRLPGHIARAVNAVAHDGHAVTVLNLGAGAPPLEHVDSSVRVVTPGTLAAAEVASMLSAGDLFLAPWTDGASTRRGTLMAALQHGLPVVSTRGPNSGPMLLDALDALELVPVEPVELFVESTRRLVKDREARERMSRRARALYAERFDWPIAADRLIDALGGS